MLGGHYPGLLVDFLFQAVPALLGVADKVALSSGVEVISCFYLGLPPLLLVCHLVLVLIRMLLQWVVVLLRDRRWRERLGGVRVN